MATLGREDLTQVTEQTIQRQPKPIKVSIPAGSASSLDEVFKLTAKLFDRLGCRTCYSGFDIRFVQEVEREFKVNPDTLDIEGVGARESH